MIKSLAIIPARGGSKRIINKNIRDFCGQPIITHVLSSTSESNLFSKIHVSTESNEIRDVAKNFGFPPDFMRPKNLADDHTPIMPVLRYTVEEYIRRGQIFDEIWLIMACSPLISSQDLQKAANLFRDSKGIQPLLAVSEYPVPIEWAFSCNKGGVLSPLQEGMFAVRSQDLEKKYYDTGSFAIFSSAHILTSKGAGTDNGFIGYIMPKGSTIDIDEEEDWKIAEAIFRAKNNF